MIDRYHEAIQDLLDTIKEKERTRCILWQKSRKFYRKGT